MTVEWSRFAQSNTDKPVKGMLTGLIILLQWTFVRGSHSRQSTAIQIALAIRDEVEDLEAAGISTIQIWVNPDGGLKTRAWVEVELALRKKVTAATSSARATKTADGRLALRLANEFGGEARTHRISSTLTPK
jgi:methionine synthase II (cobalamin-independent)